MPQPLGFYALARSEKMGSPASHYISTIRPVFSKLTFCSQSSTVRLPSTMAVMTLGTYARWVWPMTVLVFCTGAMVVGSGVLVNLLTPAQEIPLWFNVPVCPTDDTR